MSYAKQYSPRERNKRLAAKYIAQMHAEQRREELIESHTRPAYMDALEGHSKPLANRAPKRRSRTSQRKRSY